MAARFWVGGTGNWDAADTTHWSASSGGAGGASVPGASDDVTFDGSSGGGTVTVTATATVNSITSGAHTGTLDTNGQTINTGTWTNSGTGTRTVTLGASAINVTGGTTSFNWGPTTNLTFNSNTSTITINGSGVSTLSFGTSLAYYNVVIAPSANNAGIAVNGSGCSFSTYTYTGTTGKLDQLVHNSTMSATTANLNGNSATNRLLFRSNTLGTQRVFTVTTLNAQNLDLRDISFGSSKDLSAITGLSGDCGGNSGITFTTAATQTYTGGTGSWSTAAKWTSRVPLPQDDVSMSGVTGGTITADMPRLGKSIDWTGASGSPTWTLGQTSTNYGSITLISGMTAPSTQVLIFEGRSSFTLTSAGKSWPQITQQMVGGTMTLQDAVASVATQYTISNGVLNTNGFNFSTPNMFASGSSARGLTAGSSTITLSGTGTVLNIGTSTLFTMTAGSSTIIVSNVAGSTKTFAGGGLTYNDLKISAASVGSDAVAITGANTFNRIYTDGGGTKTLTFPASTTTTLSYTGTDNFGNGNHLLTIASSSGGSAFTISKPVGRFEGDYLNLTDSTATGTFYAGEHSVNVSGNSGWIFSAFSPNQSGGLTMWLDALDGGDGTFTDRLNKTAYTATSVTRGANINDGTEMIFNGTSSKIECGNIGEIYSVTFWVKPGTNACSLIDFNGTEYISTVSGTVTATSWTSPTIYVNGVVTSVLPTGVWSHVAVTSSTSVTASTVILGLISSTYGDCSLTNIKMYDRVLSATEIGRQVPSFPSANRALLQDLVDYTGLTFYKNYGVSGINSVNADYSSGSATGTWTVTRGTTTPATYCDADGTIQLVTGTNPRFTQGFYDSTGFVSRPGLIVEGAGTNLFVSGAPDSNVAVNGNNWEYSGTARWSMAYSNSGASTISISSDSKYSKSLQIAVTNQGTVAAADVRLFHANGISFVDGTTYTVSFNIKTDTAKTFTIDSVTFGTGLNTTFTTVANTWTRVQKTWAGVGTGTGFVRLLFGNNGTPTINIDSFQLEVSPFATTFIPTTTAALTRNAETLTYPISGNRTAATESLFVKFTPFHGTNGPASSDVILDDDGDRRSIYQNSANSYRFTFNPDIVDAAPTNAWASNNTAYQSYLIGATCSASGNPNQILYVDGSAGTTDNTDWGPFALGTNFYVGARFNSAQQANGIISSLAIFSDAKDAGAVAGITDLLEAL